MQHKHKSSAQISTLVILGATAVLASACGGGAAGKKAVPQAKRQATAKVPAAMAGMVKQAKAIGTDGKATVIPITGDTFTFTFPTTRFVIVFFDASNKAVANLEMPASSGSKPIGIIPYVAFSDTYFAAHPVFDFGTININLTTHIAVSTVNIFTALDTDGDGTFDFDDSDDDDDGIVDSADTDDDDDGIIDDTDDLDTDDDGLCNAADGDDDGDGIDDVTDTDDDGDGVDDEIDNDSDDDGIADADDLDDDNDGIDDASDTDDNGDGIADTSEDLDGDGILDYQDDDIDGDGMTNDVDTDDDDDGTPDASDPDWQRLND
jgi:hypothetical protein